MGVPGRFSRERAENERFDRALGAAPNRTGDEFAEELATVGALRELGATGAPDPATRARIRAEIEGRLGEPLPRRRRRLGPADLVAAGIALILGLAGLTLLLSRDALPGDALYQVKRAGEATALGLTFDSAGRAEKHLEFAAGRVDELGHLTDASPAAYRTALTDFGDDVRAGARGMADLATQDGDRTRLAELASWAKEESRLLAFAQTQAPAAARDDVTSARGLLDRVRQRTTALGFRLGCYRITTGSTDELGLLPASGACTRAPEAPGSAPAPPPSAPPSPDETAPPATSSTPDGRPELALTSSPTPTGSSVASSPAAPVVPPPITAPTSPRLPTSTRPRPPVVSVPPLLPGLPRIVIG
ncbi:DUF5667 domain-containing protein [Amycolatopsis jiangsuensis]|uniref:DUF5667 domain-containing protein n=1 Tax=Amycolatopsis jiangsuensis TaxID=1181879 RepID=A0A840IV62_9PSEU|nr:DUF5667 domain-containing protein [Amycolatopsis jiangsuensis]MBB4686611.1 hypothetical protein [Amycolatopsis jiangsuensis]